MAGEQTKERDALGRITAAFQRMQDKRSAPPAETEAEARIRAARETPPRATRS